MDSNRGRPHGSTEVSPQRFVCSFDNTPGDVIASFETEPAKNDFPDLPVHEDVNVRVRILRAEPDDDARQPTGQDREVLRLAPTTRSLIR